MQGLTVVMLVVVVNGKPVGAGRETELVSTTRRKGHSQFSDTELIPETAKESALTGGNCV